jgi:hypothetical protein
VDYMAGVLLHHGSPEIVRQPEFGAGKLHNDYGRGFYCTREIEVAREWAVGESLDGYVNSYELDMAGLAILDLTDGQYGILHWLALLMANRGVRAATPVARLGAEYLHANFLPDTGSFDVIVGYRADDSYFTFARAFVNNQISLAQLSRAMRLGDLGKQTVLVSRKAFDHIRFLGYEEVDSGVYYPKRVMRDEDARLAYQLEAALDDLDGLFMRDIVREEVEDGDPRLRLDVP